jgi:hypothetical protein
MDEQIAAAGANMGSRTPAIRSDWIRSKQAA